jgi:hypothetical protein
MKMMTADDRLLLEDPSTGKISTTCSQHVQRSFGALCYSNLTQYYFINKCMCKNITFQGCKIRDNSYACNRLCKESELMH